MRVFYAALFLLSVHATGFSQTTLYELELDSSADTGCTGPSLCLCPIQLLGPVSGSFELEFMGFDATFELYSMENIFWEYSSPVVPPVIITGTGSYRIDLANDLHRLEADLIVNGVPQFFESIGTVGGTGQFPGEFGISIFHQINGCQFDGLRIEAVEIHGDPPLFSRGDCNQDGQFNIADAVFLLTQLFGGAPSALQCDDACDGNDDENLNIADPVAYLGALFTIGSQPLPPPYPDCGGDPGGDTLSCVQSICP